MGMAKNKINMANARIKMREEKKKSHDWIRPS
jgi:hypothetical protein